ncbi:MAG: Asp-tRNA(Asn)/Glu-tRNA(Gln) amidotransferase subunit GatC [Candidatus Diapherotrites archaeon]|nr:Asp-tRNA(Asn)/Glu-tRNA(Gln) amidotransferase subunit GatC [Candidatus Diapherotrites archaeon]
MSSIDREILLRVAKNARLKLTKKEIEEFLPQLEEILKAFAKISEIDVSNEQLAVHPIEIEQKTREDKIGEGLSVEDSLKNAKHKKGNYFLGPKAIG